MILVYVIVCFIIAFISIKTEKKIFNPLFILMMMWGIIIFLSSLMYYTLFSADIDTYQTIFGGLCSFSIGYYVYILFFKRKVKKKKFYLTIEKKRIIYDTINYRICYFCFVICCIFLLYRVYKYGGQLFDQGINLKSIGAAINSDSFEFNDTGLINAIGFLVVNPLYLPLTIVWCIDFIYGKKDKGLTALMVIMTILRILTTGGRQSIIQLFISLIVAVAFSDYKRYGTLVKSALGKKNNKKMIGVVVIGVIVFLIATLSRTTEVVRTLYLDFAMQPFMFESWKDYLGDSRAYGFASLFGIVHPILYIMKNFLGIFDVFPVFFEDIKNNIQLVYDSWISIGTVLSANAYTTSFWYMYYDGGVIAIIVEMILWGAYCARSYCLVNCVPSQKNITYYIMVIIGVCYSFAEFEFSKSSYVLGFVFISHVLFVKLQNIRN